jgi:galactonate dehydratase
MSMIITRIETIRLEPLPAAEWDRLNPQSRQAAPVNCWVRIHTDDGLIGLGETYYAPRAVSAIVHDQLAPLLLGRSAHDIENHWQNQFAAMSFAGGGGAEMRAISAIDIALWDLLGQHTGQPIYQLLGGRSRDRVPVYNTCVSSGRYPDTERWVGGRAGELAKDLLANGYTAMKIWPFDQFGWTLGGPGANTPSQLSAEGRSGAMGVRGHWLTDADLAAGIAIVEDIHRATGGVMKIAIEGHARWDLSCATRIARALEPFAPLWLEEIRPSAGCARRPPSRSARASA